MEVFHVYVSERRSSLYWGVWKFSCLCFREMIFTHIGEYGSFHVYVSERRSSLISGITEVFMFMFQREDLHSIGEYGSFSCLCFRETIFTHIGEYGSFHVYVSERRSSLISGSMEVFICMFQRDDLHSYRGVWKFSFVCFRETILTHIGEYGRFHLYVSERRSSLISGSMEVLE